MKCRILALMVFAWATTAYSFSLGKDGQAAQALLEAIASGDMKTVVGQIDPTVGKPEDVYKGLMTIQGMLKAPRAPRHYFIEDWTVFQSTSGRFYRGVLRVEEDGGQTYMVHYHCKEMDGRYLFDQFRVVTVTEQEKENAKFGLIGRSVGQYAALLLALLIAVFSIITAITAWKSGLRRRVLWTLACLVSVCQVNVSWAPSEFLSIPVPVSTQIIHFSLFGAGMLRLGTYSPFVLSIGVPLGALLFWRAKRKTDHKIVVTEDAKP